MREGHHLWAEVVAVREPDVLLRRAQQLAQGYVESLARRAVAAPMDQETLATALGGPLGDGPVDPLTVVEELAQGVDPGLVATSGGRFFGFVEGGVLPAALAADWLTATWDQNPGLHVLSPAAAAVEEITAGWLLDLLGLPSTASLGFTTGAQMANFAGLAAARHDVLEKAGWDVEADGLTGAPPVAVLVGAERHVTIGRAVRFLGMGERTMVVVAADSQGRMDPDALRRTLGDVQGPSIVCAQAGNVNTGAFDPRDRRVVPGPRDLAARRRRLRAVGGGKPGSPPPRGRSRAGGLLGDRRSQMVERPLRLRLRGVRTSRKPSHGHGSACPLSGPRNGWCA